MLKSFWQLIGALPVARSRCSFQTLDPSRPEFSQRPASKLIVGQTGVVFRYLLVFTLRALRVNAQDESLVIVATHPSDGRSPLKTAFA